ncbi:Sec-independent protein translocase TatB [Kineococcus gynurae]|uniref:Sec-independent protein translocase TatB n=1 Tax=Kineococcus gynurae TaxID=452979 RepID=A0ABV5LN83_9ACTN
MFGINGGEFLVLLVVALLVLGPERLPHYAEQLAGLVRSARRFAKGAQAQMREELGPEFDEIDWKKLDPRQYDPRRIVRDALSDVWDEDDDAALKKAVSLKNSGKNGSAGSETKPRLDLSKDSGSSSRVPFDEDAT